MTAKHINRQRLLSLSLLLSFLVCYLEWGTRASFIFQMEYEILFTARASLSNFKHPAIILPLIGQLILIYICFQQRPHTRLMIAGIGLLCLLVLLILLAGILGGRPRMILSTIPFIALTIFYIILLRRRQI